MQEVRGDTANRSKVLSQLWNQSLTSCSRKATRSIVVFGGLKR